MEGKFLGGAPETFSKGVKAKIIFPRGQGKFSKGIVPVGAILAVGSYLENCFPMGHFWHHPLEFQP